MESERREEPVREFRLEGVGIVLIGVLLLIAFGLTFWAGRRWERQQAPPREVTALAVDPLEQVDDTGEVTDAAEEMTFFDTLGGGAGQAEPGRQVRPPAEIGAPAGRAGPPATAAPGGDAAATPATAEDGRFYVQVFAGRVRQSAEDLVRKLGREGYSAKLDSERDGGEQLFKVRVGGYSTRDKADAAAEKLRDQGYPTAWVVVPG